MRPVSYLIVGCTLLCASCSMRDRGVESFQRFAPSEIGVKWGGESQGDADITVFYFLQIHGGEKRLKSEDKFYVFENYSDVDAAVVHENECHTICDRVVDEVRYPDFGASFNITEVYQNQEYPHPNLNVGDVVNLECGLIAEIKEFP